jgi:hypothetical protein
MATPDPTGRPSAMARMSLRIRLGPLVYFQVDGDSCGELSTALEGFEELNTKVDAMCSDLAARVYPNGGADEAEVWPHDGDDGAP